MATIHVRLGKRSYDIRIEAGILGSIEKELRSHQLQGSWHVISSPRILRLHGQTLYSAAGGRQTLRVLSVPEGEKSKSLLEASRLVTRLIRAGADRSSLVLALGGGVIGDLSGFVASVYLRGVRLVQIPTTLLAQIDSSIGGKVGVNHPLGKNLIGTFHQPALVVTDPLVLRTLPKKEWHSGLFEAIKYGVIADSRLFGFIENHLDEIRARQPESCLHLIESCASIKARVVSRDERESGRRIILNFGHTVGHALEAVSRYGLLMHGEAVGWGMLFAVHYAEQQGILAASDAERVSWLIRELGLQTLPPIRATTVLAAMRQDKKRRGGAVRLVLPERIGKVHVHEVQDPRAITASLRACGIAVK